MEKVILVDGNNLLFRSYYATAYTGVIMRNSKGFPTNALYGFINMINKILQEEKPNYILVAFDKGKTFRHRQYKDYKAGRKTTPQELIDQMPKAREILDTMGIFHFEIEDYEADDIIGSLAKRVDLEEDFIATIISSDKDLLQLISHDVDVKLLKQNGFIRMNESTFFDNYGIKPQRMIDLKGLMGDASDNIPGVKGIGEKTALRLLQDYDTLDGIYNHIEQLSPKLKEKLDADKETAYLSRDLATIYKDIDLPFTFEQLKYQGIDNKKYIAILKELEFNSLLKKVNVDNNEADDIKNDQIEFTIVDDLNKFNLSKKSSFYLEMLGENYHNNILLGIAIYDGQKGYYIPQETLAKGTLPLTFLAYTYDLKKDNVVFNRYGWLLPANVEYDMMIAGYLLNYNIKDDIAYLARDLGCELPFYEMCYGTAKRPKKVSAEESSIMAIKKAKCIYDTRERLLNELEQEEEMDLFLNIEMPLVEVLTDMELTGINVSREYLDKMGQELSSKLQILEQRIYEDAKEKFNIMSPKQLGEVLFIHMGISYPKKGKVTNYSTSKDILDKLKDVHPIINDILEYRTLSKLYTNYVIGLINEIADDGKIHTIYNQTLTRTGRLSSISPNLQNIPIRLEYGRLIRKGFLPSKDCVLLSSDYSQIELRMFAHMSKAENLINAFKEDKDIHSQTASDIFHVPITEVTKDMRRTAKAVNFGILYGISSFGLSEDLGIDVKTAKAFIDNYLNTYPGIKEYMNSLIKDAYLLGYVQTIMNRKRNIDELKNKNYMVRNQGERMALNTPIQGSSADILKKAMIDIYRELKKRNLKSKMLLQVHDELVFDVLLTEEKEVTEIIRHTMEHVIELDVPLKVEIAVGQNWYEAK